ncbi:rna-directed dna polymerase from mobile element jockey-like [Willisornis vidua]|uniref:Rna-directed dna polymerase from mobile element jockey-like n=1 Tax=Willisornis vidua TaxID=1566151 RepID=A0ABQ9CSX1_9PASS|nr:rna-directed dna polymerase from mobile element jockey-like [Willisornis vidua]
MDSETECTLSKFDDNTKLCDVVYTLVERNYIQRNLDRLESWSYVRLMKFTYAKCKALHPDQVNSKHKYRLGGEWIKRNPDEKDLEVLVDKELKQPRKPTIPSTASKGEWPTG